MFHNVNSYSYSFRAKPVEFKAYFRYDHMTFQRSHYALIGSSRFAFAAYLWLAGDVERQFLSQGDSQGQASFRLSPSDESI